MKCIEEDRKEKDITKKKGSGKYVNCCPPSRQILKIELLTENIPTGINVLITPKYPVGMFSCLYAV